jgi:hypothetical protein
MQIPREIAGLLWDVDVDRSSADGSVERLVIERVMERGRWEDMRWLAGAFDRAQLRRFLEQRGRKVLAPRELSFWANFCNVKAQERTAWVEEARRRQKEWRG